MAKPNRSRLIDSSNAAVNALDDMEPDFRHLLGLMVAFRTLGEARDAVEPVAIASIARCASETLADLDGAWGTAIKALRKLAK